MSWSGFKKNVGRATTQVMMKTGHVEKTTDREYEVEERRFRTLESASLRLQKEAKGYLDSLRAMTASQMRIAETIDAFYGDSGARDGVSRSYKQAVEDLDAETIKALDGPYRYVPADLRKYACGEEEGSIDEKEILQIEWQMNHSSMRTQAASIAMHSKEERELMDYVYRQTVLEPINRFCAYFPDINECIKKRNHKMLDYDALRSKVKKLTEKPDKDASKLPRTEKELEMVSAEDFITEDSPTSDFKHTYPPIVAPKRRPLRRSATAPLSEHDALDMPSPPKILGNVNRSIDRVASQPALPSIEEDSSATPGRDSLDHEPESPSVRAWLNQNARQASQTPSEHALLHRGTSLELPALDDRVQSFEKMKSSPAKRHTLDLSPLRSPSLKRSDSTSRRTSSPLSSIMRKSVTTPFFNPSELEEIMRPIKEKFLQEEADLLSQAKAAYDQLNEQLTSELPQLIDLRVPYLDPSFEALVKIQLRFCAEAYSRMAQVQQYLDASTRDQYASGELDGRVEDVLGQIRELSIAGTV